MSSINQRIGQLALLVAAVGFLHTNVQGQIKIPASSARPVSDAGDEGFIWRVHQAPAGSPGANNHARAEAQLSGTLENLADELAVWNTTVGDGKRGGPNDPVEFEIAPVLNLDQGEGGGAGAAKENDGMPGIPGLEGSTDLIAAEVLTWLQMSPGVHELIVNSDDGFLMTMGGGGPNDKFATKVGEFNGGRGASDTAFQVEIEEEGLYPARILWYEGGGGANIEFVVRVDGTKYLVNGENLDADGLPGGDPSPIKAFRSVSGSSGGAFASAVSPAPGENNVFPNASIEVTLGGAGDLAASDINLSVDGAAVNASVNKSGSEITVSWEPSSLYASGSSHTASLNIGGTTRTWDFTVANFATLTPDMAVTPDTSKRGFLYSVHQSDVQQVGSVADAKARLAGQHIDGSTGEPLVNTADPNAADGTAGSSGPSPASWGPVVFEIDDVINFDENGDPQGAFNGDNGSPENFNPGIPGLDGGVDDYAVDITYYAELPAGVTVFGVASDDGYETTAGQLGDIFLGPVAGADYGTHGVRHSTWPVVVEEAGTYAFRTVWFERGGGASIEMYTVDSDGDRTLLNSDGGVKTYREATGGTAGRAFVRSASPSPNSTAGARPTISVQLVDGNTAIDSGSISLTLNGAAVVPDIAKADRVTTVTFKPQNPLALDSANTVEFGFSEGGDAQTRSWTFNTVANDGILAWWDFNDASNPAVAVDKVSGIEGLLLGDMLEAGLDIDLTQTVDATLDDYDPDSDYDSELFAAYSPGGEGRTGESGDRALWLGEEDTGQHMRVEPLGWFNDGAAAQDQMTVSFWQKWSTDIKNQSVFWFVSPSTGSGFRGASGHTPWGNNIIYFDTGGCCNGATQRTNRNIDALAQTEPDYDREEFWQEWTHLAFVKKGSTKEIWVNGELLIRKINTNPLPTDFKHVVFGEEHNISNGMNGWMDDIAVFAAGLAEEDIKRLAGGASPEEIRPLVAPEPTPPPVVVDPPVVPGLPPIVLPPIPGQQPGEISGIAFDNGNAVITYTGTLMSSDTVDGTYAPVAGAASPFTATTTGSAKFYIAR